MSSGERVLSIQSHVTFGYVGGKAAVFPLQCLGYDVDVINTVNFSNHSGYGRFKGSKSSASDLQEIVETMEKNELLNPDRLLTGYIPNGEALSAVKDIATKLRRRHPKLIYLLDPVLGDSGKLYVSRDVIPVYQSMLPLSTIITPNWFEVEVLTGNTIVDMASLRQAIKTLHDEHHVPNVVISSIPLKSWLLNAIPSGIRPDSVTNIDDCEDAFLLCVSSSKQPGQDQSPVVHAQCVPCIPGYFSGVGDLFSALVLAHYQPDIEHASGATPLAHAVSLALAKTHAILTLTHEYSKTLPQDEQLPTDDERDAGDSMRRVRRMKGRELRLIQGQDIIREQTHLETRNLAVWTDFWTI